MWGSIVEHSTGLNTLHDGPVLSSVVPLRQQFYIGRFNNERCILQAIVSDACLPPGTVG